MKITWNDIFWFIVFEAIFITVAIYIIDHTKI